MAPRKRLRRLGLASVASLAWLCLAEASGSDGLVRIPAGSFLMGSPATEPERDPNEELTRVMGTKPSGFRGPRLPVENVSWFEALVYCNKRSLSEGLSPCYRLFGTGENITTAQANYQGEYPYNGNPQGVYRAKTTPVASFPPNAWGLYDMHGNVWEWCWDWIGEYPRETISNPTGALSFFHRVVRGASWHHFGSWLRSA